MKGILHKYNLKIILVVILAGQALFTLTLPLIILLSNFDAFVKELLGPPINVDNILSLIYIMGIIAGLVGVALHKGGTKTTRYLIIFYFATQLIITTYFWNKLGGNLIPLFFGYIIAPSILFVFVKPPRKIINTILISLCSIIILSSVYDAMKTFQEKSKKPLNLPGKIVFHSERNEKGALGIYILEKGVIKRLDTGNWVHFYKNGSHIVYQGTIGTQSGYVVFDLQTGEKQFLPFPKEYVVYDYDISPNGRRIAFIASKVQYSKYKVPQPNLFVANIDGAEMKQLTDSGESIHHPRWSPDGKSILFTCAEDPLDQTKGGLFLIEPTGSNLRKILENITRYGIEPSWSPDGKKIAFNYDFEDKGADDIYIMNVDGSGLKRVTNSVYDDRMPVFSPDGKQILFVSYRHPDPLAKGAELYVINIDGTNERQVTPPKKIKAYGRWRYVTDSNPDWVE